MIRVTGLADDSLATGDDATVRWGLEIILMGIGVAEVLDVFLTKVEIGPPVAGDMLSITILELVFGTFWEVWEVTFGSLLICKVIR